MERGGQIGTGRERGRDYVLLLAVREILREGKRKTEREG